MMKMSDHTQFDSQLLVGALCPDCQQCIVDPGAPCLNCGAAIAPAAPPSAQTRRRPFDDSISQTLSGSVSLMRLAAFLLDRVFLLVILQTMFRLCGSGPPHEFVKEHFWSILISVPFIYFFTFEALTSTSPGKALCGLTVRTETNSRLSWQHALVRSGFRLFEAGIIAGLVIIFSKKGQRLGDLATGTYVVGTGFATASH